MTDLTIFAIFIIGSLAGAICYGISGATERASKRNYWPFGFGFLLYMVLSVPVMMVCYKLAHVAHAYFLLGT